ncbi:uncharacterized protein At4g04775-like [Eutrema salsugineum]|uniref:uncharacterized protein At4g04775-like n=1 Tax=Eutrema salsugineum TaxID=72664 RepID=UPI000CED7656|nr:uncharacterized protein At4g04775-like [Eutrema salsugineum]
MTLSHSSDSSRSSISSRGHGFHGIPSKCCFCGSLTVIMTSHTTINPGRRFYTCSNSLEGVHVWKWWDEAISEEVIDLKEDLKSLEARLRYGHGVSDCVHIGEDELKMLKDLSVRKSKEAKEVKIVVALVVVIISVGVLVSLVK